MTDPASPSPWLRRAAAPALSIRFDRHEMLAAADGDSVSLALLGHGIVETSTSAKYRRPRGPFCLAGDCGTCLVRIDGRPNQRACLARVREGRRVEPQNRLTEAGPDPTRLVDKVIGTMDHHHFMVRPRVVNQAMQAVARELTGFGTLPDRVPDAPSVHRVHDVDVLLVGAGPAGRAAAEVLATAGRRVLWVDRGLDAPTAGSLSCLPHTGVFGAYRREGLWSAMTDDGTAPPTLHTIRATDVLLCVGARVGATALPDNDRPGVVAARGLRRQLDRVGAELSVDLVVVGDGPHAEALAASFEAPLVAADRVREIEGGSRVERLVTKDGRHDVDLLALAPTPSPAHDLPRQAGAQVRFDGTGFAAVRDDDGRCVMATGAGELGTVWAAGDVAGYVGDAAAAEDGRRVAARLLARGGGG